MSVSNCLLEAREAMSLFTNDELKEYTKDVLQRARSYDDLKGMAAIDRAIKEIGDQRMQEMVSFAQIKINTLEKYEKNAADIESKKVTLRELIARRTKNLAGNIESYQRTARKLLGNAFFGVLEKDEFKYMVDGKNDIEIVRAIDGRENVSDIAKNIAKKFMDFIDYRNAEMVSSDALSIYHLNKDRFLRAIHDRNLLMNGGKSLANAAMRDAKVVNGNTKDIWRDFIKSQLDMEKTFENTNAIGMDGKLNPAEADKILDEIYDSIVADKPEIFAGGKGSQRMFFYWKNMEAMYTYSQKYGRKSLFANVMADVNASGNKIGMSQMFGDNPTKMYNDLAELQQKVNPISKTASWNNKLTFNHLAGIDQSPVNATAANFFTALRTLTSMKSLGKIAFLSLPDISNGIAFAKRWGFDYWGAYTTYMGGLFDKLPSEDRAYISQVFKEMTDTHMGYVGRFLDANNVPQLLQTASTYFFRGVGLEALDRGNKVSGLYLLAKNLGNMSSRSWAELPELTRKQFDKFDFTEQEWNLLRQKNRRGMFTVDNVNELSDSDVKAIYGDNAKPLYQMKNDLYRKVYSMFDVWAENSVLTPGAFMRATTMQGTRAGTISGELLRTVMQFKAYSLTFLDRVLYQGFSDADGAQAKVAFMVQLMGATIPMSFLSYWLNNRMSGRSMPSFDAMNVPQKVKYASEIMMPSLGMLNMFFDPNKENQDLISNMINTPSMKVLSNAMAAPIQLATGQMDEDGKMKFMKSLEKMGKGITPGLSLPFIDPYLRQAMGDKAFLQPGQIQLYGA